MAAPARRVAQRGDDVEAKFEMRVGEEVVATSDWLHGGRVLRCRIGEDGVHPALQSLLCTLAEGESGSSTAPAKAFGRAASDPSVAISATLLRITNAALPTSSSSGSSSSGCSGSGTGADGEPAPAAAGEVAADPSASASAPAPAPVAVSPASGTPSPASGAAADACAPGAAAGDAAVPAASPANTASGTATAAHADTAASALPEIEVTPAWLAKQLDSIEGLKRQGNDRVTGGDIPAALHRYWTALQYLGSVRQRLLAAQARAPGDDTSFADAARRADELFVSLQSNASFVYARQGKWESALDAADQALAQAPTHEKALYRRALALEALSRRADAVAATRQLLDCFPANADGAALAARLQASTEEPAASPAPPTSSSSRPGLRKRSALEAAAKAAFAGGAGGLYSDAPNYEKPLPRHLLHAAAGGDGSGGGVMSWVDRGFGWVAGALTRSAEVCGQGVMRAGGLLWRGVKAATPCCPHTRVEAAAARLRTGLARYVASAQLEETRRVTGSAGEAGDTSERREMEALIHRAMSRGGGSGGGGTA